MRWPALGITAGPFAARVLLDGDLHDTAAGDGGWKVETGAGFGRPGAWARWRPRSDGPALHLHVPADGDTVVAEAVARSAADARLDRLVPLAGPVDLGADVATAVRLVEGYDSWSYAGVRAAATPGRSWWRAAFVRADGAALAVHALDAARFATVVESAASAGELRIAVDCGAAPAVELAPGSWGYEVLAPPALDLPVAARTDVRSPAIALSAGADAFALVERGAELAGVTSARRRWTGAPIGGWESWYHYGLFVEPDDIVANARLLRERYDDRPDFDMVQIDDGWQRHVRRVVAERPLPDRPRRRSSASCTTSAAGPGCGWRRSWCSPAPPASRPSTPTGWCATSTASPSSTATGAPPLDGEPAPTCSRGCGTSARRCAPGGSRWSSSTSSISARPAVCAPTPP